MGRVKLSEAPCRNISGKEDIFPARDVVTCCEKPEMDDKTNNPWYFSAPPKKQRNNVKRARNRPTHLSRVTRCASISSTNAFDASLVNRIARFDNRNTGDLKIPTS